MPVASHVTPAPVAWSIRASWSITGTGVPAIDRRARIVHDNRAPALPGVPRAAAVACGTGQRGRTLTVAPAVSPAGRADGGRAVVPRLPGPVPRAPDGHACVRTWHDASNRERDLDHEMAHRAGRTAAGFSQDGSCRYATVLRIGRPAGH